MTIHEKAIAPINTTLCQAAPFSLINFATLPLFQPLKRLRLPTLLGAVISKPLDPGSILYDGMPETRLPIGNLIYVTSLNVLCAYIFEFPNNKVAVFPHYMVVYRADALERTMFEDARPVHQNQHINIFWSEHGAMLINFVNKNTFFDPNDLRGGH